MKGTTENVAEVRQGEHEVGRLLSVVRNESKNLAIVPVISAGFIMFYRRW